MVVDIGFGMIVGTSYITYLVLTLLVPAGRSIRPNRNGSLFFIIGFRFQDILIKNFIHT